MARMLGRYGWSPHSMSGQHRCRECGIGWPVGPRHRKRAEARQWRREAGL